MTSYGEPTVFETLETQHIPPKGRAYANRHVRECTADGETAEAALIAARDAIVAWLG